MGWHRRLQLFRCEAGLFVFVPHACLLPRLQEVGILWINCCWILCQIIAKSNLFVSQYFPKSRSRSPSESPAWYVLTWCSRHRIPAVWALIPTPCSVLFFVSYVVNEKNDEQFFAEAFVLTATSNLSSFSCVCFIWSCMGGSRFGRRLRWMMAAAFQTEDSRRGVNLSFSQWSTSFSQTQTISNTFYHVWSHAW